MSSMEEEAVLARAHGSVLDLFRMPVLRRRTCAMLVVKYADLVAAPRDTAETRGAVARTCGTLGPHEVPRKPGLVGRGTGWAGPGPEAGRCRIPLQW